MVSTELQTSIRETVTIPTLPATVLQIRDVMSRPGAGVADVAEIVAQDPPMAARVLRLANTAYYAPREKIGSIKHASAVLGMGMLENLVLQATLIEVFSDVEGRTAHSLWTHSTLTAQTAQVIVERSKLKSTLPLSVDEFYTCGLLHDIGEFVLLGSLQHSYLDLLSRSRDEYRESYYQEKQELGYTHTEVGAMMAHLWRFPNPIVEAIEWHHFPRTRLRGKPHVAVVVLADQMADLIQGRRLRSTANPDITLLRDIQVSLRETEEILQFAERCLEDIEI